MEVRCEMPYIKIGIFLPVAQAILESPFSNIMVSQVLNLNAI